MSDAPNPTGERKPAKVSLFGRKAPLGPPGPKSDGREPRPDRRRRRPGLSTLSALLSFILVGAFIGIAGFAAALVEIHRPGPLAEDKVVQIAREDDGGPIAEQLERAGVVDSAIAFSAMTLIDGKRSGLKRGEYDFKPHVSSSDVEQLLLSGKVVLHRITIPEGLTSDQIVQRLRDNEILVGEVKEPPREGSLLPETYSFPRGETRQALLAKMAKDQAKLVDEIWSRRDLDLPVKSPGELVTLASIVEKETGKPEERPRVAAVFINRLQRHMKLQSDPTIVYGLAFGKGTLGRPISKADLTLATPYNTYIIDGLPPGPICNPGKAALEAAADPLHSNELYFVADGTGGHAFAVTLDQHLKNVARWREIEQDAKDKLAPDAAAPGAPAVIPAAAKHTEIPPPDPKVFGALAPEAPPTKPDPSAAKLTKKLEKVAGALRRQEAELVKAEKPLDAIGAVVTGVNDGPQTVSFGDETANAPTAYAPGAKIPPYAPNPANRGKVFDVSEGTALDPLLDKTYDLSYAKTIPDLK